MALTDIKFSELGWQTHDFPVTLAAAPAIGFADQIKIDNFSVRLVNDVTETDTPGTYIIEFEPFEINGSASVSLEYVNLDLGDALVFPADPVVISLTDPATLSTEIQYCTIFELYTRFGYENVNKWADMGNDREINSIAQKIIDEIVVDSRNTDGRLRGRYNDIPFVEPFPIPIVNLTRLTAGVALYGSRGIEDDNDRLNSARMEADKLLREIASGVLILDLPSAISYGSFE